MSGVEHQRCPRRDESPNPDAYGDGTATPDSWRVNGPDQGFAGSDGMRACSYCGSMHPDDLMKAIVEDGWTLGPTDKNYKVYVEGPEGSHKAHKFYFQHLSDAQQTAFIGLLNAGKLKVGYPGHFYRLPFFIGRKAKES